MLREKYKWRPPRGAHHEASVPMRSTGTDQLVRARKAGNAAGAKGLGQAVVVMSKLPTGGDLGGNEAVGCLVGAVCGERLPHRSVRGRGGNSSGLLAPHSTPPPAPLLLRW